MRENHNPKQGYVFSGVQPQVGLGYTHTQLYGGRGRVHAQSHYWARARPRPTLSWAWMPHVGPGRDRIQLHVGRGRVHAPPHFGPGRVHAQLHGGLGYVCAPFSPGLRAWIEPNVPQIWCIIDGLLYTKPPIVWVWVINYDIHHILLNTNKQPMLMLT